MGKPKVPSQASAAALAIHLLAAGALPRHLVTQRAQRALRMALTCWKTPTAKLCPERIPTSLLIADTAQRQCKQRGWKIQHLWKYFLYCFTHNHGFKALKTWGMHEEPGPGTGSGGGCQVLTIAAVEAEAIAACRAGVTAASHNVGFALTLAPQFTAAGIQ